MSAKAVVLEAKKEVGRGIVATVLVQDGTLKIGDPFFSGSTYGRVRAMTDERGKRIHEAGPATPVQVTGFEDVPNAGDGLSVVDDDTQARMIGQLRQEKAREAAQQKGGRVSLDQLFQRLQQGATKDLNLIVKADVQGSVEVLNETLRKLSTSEVKVNVIHTSVGAITTNDAARDRVGCDRGRLQRASGAQRRGARGQGRRRRPSLHGHLHSWTRSRARWSVCSSRSSRKFQGRAEVRDTFKVPKIGVVAGCMVTDGVVPRTANVRLLRDNRVIYEGKIGSLRHFKNDVSEVRQASSAASASRGSRT
jgi:translation initiation factor IF-2